MKINSLFRTLALSLVIASMTVPTYATNDLKDLLNTVKSKAASSKASDSNSDSSNPLGKLGGLISSFVASSDFDIKDLAGTWLYQSPAVSFASDNALQKVGGAAAASTIEEKIAPYYDKAGIGSLKFTVDADSTFSMNLRRITLKGNITKDDHDNLIFNFKAMGKVKLGKLTAHATKSGDTLSLTFDISKLVSLLQTVTAVTNMSSLNTVSKLLSSYDGIYAGFRLKAVKQ